MGKYVRIATVLHACRHTTERLMETPGSFGLGGIERIYHRAVEKPWTMESEREIKSESEA